MASTIIGVKEVRTLPPGAVVCVKGFGARRQRSEAVTCFVMYRTAAGRQRWQTIGRHGLPWTPDEAGRAALRILAEAAHGTDPAAVSAARKKALTVAALCDRYLADVWAGRLLTRRGTSKNHPPSRPNGFARAGDGAACVGGEQQGDRGGAEHCGIERHQMGGPCAKAR